MTRHVSASLSDAMVSRPRRPAVRADSEAELAKFIELGHLQPNDLLWREGFPTGVRPLVVFPPRAAPQRPRRTGATEPAASLSSSDDWRAPRKCARTQLAGAKTTETEPRRRRGTPGAGHAASGRRALGAAAWFAYPYRDRLTDVDRLDRRRWLRRVRSRLRIARAWRCRRWRASAARRRRSTPSCRPRHCGASSSASFRTGTRQRLDEAITLARDNKNEAAIGQHMARKLVELRRQQVSNALSATLPRLKGVAAAFFDNLAKLRQHSVGRLLRVHFAGRSQSRASSRCCRAPTTRCICRRS